MNKNRILKGTKQNKYLNITYFIEYLNNNNYNLMHNMLSLILFNTI